LPKVQHILIKKEQKKLEKRIDTYLHASRIQDGNLKNDEQARKELITQNAVNKCEVNSAYLHANPGDYLVRMNNDQFKNALQHRLLLNMKKNKVYCECGEKIGPLMHHGYRCKFKSVRNKIRNNAHRSLSIGMRKLLNDFVYTKKINASVLKNEPILKDFFLPQDVNIIPRKKRGDILLADETCFRIIDVSMTESTVQDKYKIGSAGAVHLGRKFYEYRQWNLNGNNNKLIILVTETFCTIPEETKRQLKKIVRTAIEDMNEYNSVIKQFFERLSIIMHNIRTYAYWNLYNLHSSERFLAIQ
jgi:hypothetical protein